MNRVTAAMVNRGERRIAERREQVKQAAIDVRKLISDLIDDNERLKREVRSLQIIVHDQARVLDRADYNHAASASSRSRNFADVGLDGAGADTGRS